MKKILIVSSLYYPNIGGGAEVSTKILAEGLVKIGHDITVLTAGYENTEELINGVKVIRVDLGRRTRKILSFLGKSDDKFSKMENILFKLSYICNYKLYKFYYDYLKINKYDWVHTSNNMANFGLFMCWKAASKLGCKVMHTLRDPALLCFRVEMDNKKSSFDFLFKKISNYYLKYVNIIHSPSKYMIEMHKKNGIKLKETVIVPNTIDMFPKTPEYALKENVCVYMGKFEKIKGIETLMNAIENRKDVEKAIFIGNGGLENAIKNRSTKFETTGWIERETAYDIIKKAKVLVLPSEWEEAFGRTLIEAAYNGTLVIGSDRGAIPEVLDEDKRYIFKSGDSKELGEKISRILELSEENYGNEWKSMMKKMDRFSIEKHVDKFNEVYIKI